MRVVAAIVVEAILVAVAGAVLALAANAVSPRGLRLDRNYFPAGEKSPATVATGVPSPAAPAAPVPAAGAPADPAAAAVLRRLQKQGLRAITAREAIAWFGDPQYEQGLTVFVDARDDAHFQAGHIPGAWQFDHYRAEKHLATVLPVCLTALKVVVYCTGGQCEDSEFAAILLRDAGVPRENLFVYPGGISEWTANQQRVEIGARRSGRYLPNKP